MKDDDSEQVKGFVLAAMEDLFFLPSIQETANRAGFAFCQTNTRIGAKTLAQQNPVLVVLDLQSQNLEPLELIRELKQEEKTAPVPIVAYYPHVKAELGQSAKDAGADVVTPRSAFLRTLKDAISRVPVEPVE